MRWGCCGSIDQAEAIQQAGFDFLEVNVQAVLQGEVEDAPWEQTLSSYEASPLPIEAANCLVPGSLPVLGPTCDLPALQQYMERVSRRAKRLGMTRLVFGSGGARRRPTDLSTSEAYRQLEAFTRLAGEVCGEQGILLVIEHLNQSETNTINSLEQAMRLCDRVSLPSVQVLVDSYHYGLENETDDALIALGSRIRHVHVAEPVDRLQPGGHGDLSDKAFDFVHFFALLRKVGYGERISIEAKWSKPIEENGASTLALLKESWEAAERAEIVV